MKQVNGAKEQKGRFLRILLGALVASSLGNLLTAKGVMGAGKGAIRAAQRFNAASSFNKF